MPGNQNPVFTDNSTVFGDGTEEHPLTAGGGNAPAGNQGDVQFNNHGVFGNANAIYAGAVTNLSSAGAYTFEAPTYSFNDGNGHAVIAISTAASSLTLGFSNNYAVEIGSGPIVLAGTNLTTSQANNNQLNVGVSGAASGILGLQGSTSGMATITAPAVAGTVTNPIVSSNAISVPAGNAGSPMLLFGGTGGSATGFLSASASTFVICQVNGVFSSCTFNSGGITGICAGLGSIGFAAAIDDVPDTAISRLAANVLAVGDGTPGDFSGTVQATLYNANGTNGVSAGPFAGVSSIQTIGGIVTTLTFASDERLKTTKPYRDGLSAIVKIHPMRFHWNKKGIEYTKLTEAREYIGFTAQDVQHAIPEAVTGTETDEKYLCLSERPIIAALVNAVKELHVRLSRTEAQLARA
jgi:hypothetical protein